MQIVVRITPDTVTCEAEGSAADADLLRQISKNRSARAGANTAPDEKGQWEGLNDVWNTLRLNASEAPVVTVGPRAALRCHRQDVGVSLQCTAINSKGRGSPPSPGTLVPTLATGSTAVQICAT